VFKLQKLLQQSASTEQASPLPRVPAGQHPRPNDRFLQAPEQQSASAWQPEFRSAQQTPPVQ
jgi:hypothetical protein